MTYSVNSQTFDSYMTAIAAAKTADAKVIEIKTGLVRWEPAAKKDAKPATRHILVKEDGSRHEIIGRNKFRKLA